VASLKAILNQVLGESGFLVPASYIGSGAPDDEQMAYLANAASDMIREDGLQELRRTATFTMGAATAYTLPSDWLGYVPDTAYIQGRLDPVILPTTAQEWQQMLAAGTSPGLYVRARIMRGQLQVIEPQVGDVIQMEYVSNAPWTTADTVTAKERATLDSDLCLFDFRLMVDATKWMWKKEKGLPDWQVDQAKYLRQANAVRARNAGARTIVMGGPTLTHDNPPYTNLWVRP
jgi:hypothetical protein